MKSSKIMLIGLLAFSVSACGDYDKIKEIESNSEVVKVCSSGYIIHKYSHKYGGMTYWFWHGNTLEFIPENIQLQDFCS